MRTVLRWTAVIDSPYLPRCREHRVHVAECGVSSSRSPIRIGQDDQREVGSPEQPQVMFVSRRLFATTQSVDDDVEQVSGAGVPLTLLEAAQKADEEDDVTGVDVRADSPVG